MPQHQARKRFGQNFLVDEGVVESIVRAVNPAASRKHGRNRSRLSALTQPLLHALERLTVIEIDRDLVARLRHKYPADRLIVVQSDVLKVDFSELGDRLRVVGNLPYNISSPLLFHLVAVCRSCARSAFHASARSH